jgi:uncharacterized RDD family membrane protein YckC
VVGIFVNKFIQFAIKSYNLLNLNKLSTNIDYQYATFWERLMAYNIDFTILILSLIPLRFITEENSLFYFLSAVIVLLYHALQESSNKNGTLGKIYFKYKVTNLDGSKLSFAKAIFRFLLKIISAFPAFLGFTMIGFNKRNQAFHDYILGTIVWKEELKNENNPISIEK